MYPVLQIGGLSFPAFQSVLFCAVFLCLFVYALSPRYDITRFELYLQCLPAGMIGALLGGKLLYAGVLLAQGGACPPGLRLFDGFVFYGGMLGGFLGIGLFSLVCRRNVWDHLDVTASLLPLGQAVGRFGCYCNGCCYGRPWDGPLAVPYPVDGTWMTVFPTWFAEAAGCLILFLILHFIVPKHRGAPTAWYLTGYAVLRFFIEFLRGDQIRGVWSILSTSQILSIAMLGIGIWTSYFIAGRRLDNLYFIEKE